MNHEQERASVFVAGCPLPSCAWNSEPLRSDTHAFEALRAHINGHAHGELVQHICKFADVRISRYDRKQP